MILQRIYQPTLKQSKSNSKNSFSRRSSSPQKKPIVRLTSSRLSVSSGKPHDFVSFWGSLWGIHVELAAITSECTVRESGWVFSRIKTASLVYEKKGFKKQNQLIRSAIAITSGIAFSVQHLEVDVLNYLRVMPRIALPERAVRRSFRKRTRC